MLVIRELARALRDLVAYSVATRRIGVLLAALAVAVAATTAATVTHLGPVAVYPFL